MAQPELSDTNGILKDHQCARAGPLNSTLSGESGAASPMCVSPPSDISTLLNLPQNLTSLYGRPTVNRRTEKDRKIVLYVLAADDSYQIEKTILLKLLTYLQDKYSSKGFEIHVADLHVPENYSKSNKFDLENWLDGPLEAQCGHHLAANCLAEITSNLNKLIAIQLVSSIILSCLQDIQPIPTLFHYCSLIHRSATLYCL